MRTPIPFLAFRAICAIRNWLLIAVCSDAAAPDDAPARSVKNLKLKVSANGRYFVDQDGKPFFYLGDTCWLLFQRPNREEVDEYLKDRAAKGFTVIQAYVLRGLGKGQAKTSSTVAMATTGSTATRTMTASTAKRAMIRFTEERATTSSMETSVTTGSMARRGNDPVSTAGRATMCSWEGTATICWTFRQACQGIR